MNLRKLVVCNCLIACYLFSDCILSAQNVSPPAPALPEQTATSADSTTPAGSGNSAAVAEETPPAADPQSQGDRSANGNGNVNANGKLNANRNKPAPAATPYMFPTNGQLGEYWVRNSLGAKAFLGATISASFNTWVHTTPDKWGHRRGWGKRFGVGLLDNSLDQSAEDLLSLAMNQDPMYYRCGCSGAWQRAKNAIKQSFMSHNRSGDYVFSPAKIVSPFVGPMVTRNTIYPYGYKSSDGARSGAYALAENIGWNLFKEFIFNIGSVVK